jgi:hypothetical protein
VARPSGVNGAHADGVAAFGKVTYIAGKLRLASPRAIGSELLRLVQRLPNCLLALVVVTVSTAAESEPDVDESAAEGLTVEEILNRDPEQEDYADDTRCISTNLIRDVEVIDEKHIAFQMRRDKYYLVQMQHRCPGLRRGQPVMYEPTASRLCVHDSVRSLYEHGIGGLQPGMRCAIPSFELVTKEQLMLLKDALKAEKRKAREAS